LDWSIDQFVTNNQKEVMEVLTGPERRRRWSADKELAMVRETFEPGKTVLMVARLHGINPNQLFQWRKLRQDNSLSAVAARRSCACVQVERRAEADKGAPAPLGQQNHGERDSPGSRGGDEVAKMDSALTFIAGGRPVKQVCEVLGVARSNVSVKLAWVADWQDGRRARKMDDAGILDEIRLLIADLPNYGYRRC
jgi:transposase-like protein